jgi:hypothetical protein
MHDGSFGSVAAVVVGCVLRPVSMHACRSSPVVTPRQRVAQQQLRAPRGLL